MEKLTDLAALVAKPRTVEIKHPATGEGLKVFVTLLPKDHPRVMAQTKMMQDRILQLRQRNKMPTAAQTEAFEISLIAAAIDGWDWEKASVSFHGEKPDFSFENAKAVISELAFFRDQLDEELADTAAFFQV